MKIDELEEYSTYEFTGGSKVYSIPEVKEAIKEVKGIIASEWNSSKEDKPKDNSIIAVTQNFRHFSVANVKNGEWYEHAKSCPNSYDLNQCFYWRYLIKCL